jgi:hypothetical protein
MNSKLSVKSVGRAHEPWLIGGGVDEHLPACRQVLDQRVRVGAMKD